MSDLLFRGRGHDVGVRASATRVRAAGAALGVGIALLADALGVWSTLGVSDATARLSLLVGGALLAPTAVGAGLWFVAGALTTLLMLVCYTPLVVPVARMYVRSDPRTGPPPDAIVVYSGAVTSGGRVMGSALERLLSAMEEARRRNIPQLGLSVVGDEDDALTPTSEQDQRALLALALPDVDARFVRNVRSTRDESLAFAALGRTLGWRRVVVITSPTHTRRACASLEAEGLSVECRPAAERVYDLGRLDRPNNRRLAFADFLYESAATALYKARGWIR